jgi:hypothetical protein
MKTKTTAKNTRHTLSDLDRDRIERLLRALD